MKLNKNKRILPALLIALLAIGIASAGIVTYFGRITTNVDVDQSVTLDGEGCIDNICEQGMELVGGASEDTNEYMATSASSVDGQIKINNDVSDVCLATTTKYNLHAEGITPREARIRIEASDAGVTYLSELASIEWNQNVQEGYIGHVDVRVIKEDGTEDALVFEYAKVDPDDCDDAEDYPTGEVNTFGDKGIVDDLAYAWLSSGLPGACGVPDFENTYNSFANWKSGDEGIDGDSKIVAFEFEVDSWIETSTNTISNIRINDIEQNVITIQAEKSIPFYNTISADFACEEGSYTITTEVQPQ